MSTKNSLYTILDIVCSIIKEYNEQYDFINLCRSSKKYMELFDIMIKNNKIKIHLNNYYSYEFIKNYIFRNKFIKIFSNPTLTIVYNEQRGFVKFLNKNKNFKITKFIIYQIFSNKFVEIINKMYQDVEYIEFACCDCVEKNLNFENLSSLVKLKSLIFNFSFSNILTDSNIDKIKFIDNLKLDDLKKITNISSLTNVKELILSRISLTDIDISMLKNIKKLQLELCDKITQITSFNNLICLELIECESIKEISSLDNIQKIIITRCQKLTDISTLSNCKTIIIKECLKLSKIKKLINIQHMNITFCHRLNYILDDFSSIHNLELRELSRLETIGGKIDMLQISFCGKINYIVMLANIKKLNIIIFIHEMHNIYIVVI